MNLLEGRRSYFKLPCYKKKFPLKFQVELFTGTFEVCISKTKNRPGTAGYDYLYSIKEFEVNYEHSHSIKYLYFKIKALERLQLRFMVTFKEKPVKASLPSLRSPLSLREDQSHRKLKAYEFFHKNMNFEESLQLKKIAGFLGNCLGIYVLENIQLERKLKAEKMVQNSKDFLLENKTLASQYDIARLNQYLTVVSEI